MDARREPNINKSKIAENRRKVGGKDICEKEGGAEALNGNEEEERIVTLATK